MKSIKSVYKIGNGPSSSHTVGPYRAARLFRDRYPNADSYQVTLFGSLAFTGEGHGTGKAIRSAIPEAEIVFDRKEEENNLPHPNTMLFVARKGGEEIGRKRIFSIGGGSIQIEDENSDEEREIYPQKHFSEILSLCKEKSINLPQFIYRVEDPSFREYLRTIWHAMQDAVERGLQAEGILPGGLGVSRKAKLLYSKRCYNESADVTMNRVIAAYAYAVSEENADENVVVTAPTCGSCGVLPAVMYYMQKDRGFPEDEIISIFGGCRPHADTNDFVIGEPDDAPGFVNAGGTESPAFTACYAIAQHVAGICIDRLKPPVNENFDPHRPAKKAFRDMTNEERRAAIAENPDYAKIVCRCEMVTEAEIRDAIRRPLGARSISEIKLRTRAGMGRCQGGFCSPRVLEILSEELGISPLEVTQCGGSSRVLAGLACNA